MAQEKSGLDKDDSNVSGRDIENLLKKIGLTEYKAKIYIALVKHGICDAKKLSGVSGVPVTRVYESLKEMKEDGLIAVENKRPKKYKINSLNSLEKLIEHEREKMEEKIREKKNIFEKIKEISPKPANEELEDNNEGIWFIEEVENTIENFKKDIKDEEDKILIFSGDLSWVPNLHEDLEEAMKRGVKIKSLYKKGNKTKPRVEKLKNIGIEVKDWNDHNLRGAIFNEDKISLVLKKSDKEESGNNKFNYEKITSHNPVFIKNMRRYFEFWWNKD